MDILFAGGLLSLVACVGGLLLVGGLAGTTLLLMKFGVITHYWLKDKQTPEATSDYTLIQSREAYTERGTEPESMGK